MTEPGPDPHPSPRPSRRLLGWLIAGVVLALVAAVWLGPRLVDRFRGDRVVSADTPLTDQCDEVPDAAGRLVLGVADDRDIGGASIGPRDASTVVVLRHGGSQTICDWLGWADGIAAEHSVRVILFDRRGQGSAPGAADIEQEDDDLLVAVSRAHEEGADKVVLVASSMGNAAMFSSLPLLRDAGLEVCTAVSISPVLAAGALDGRSPSPLPRTTWITWEWQNESITRTARDLGDAAERQGVQTRALHVDTDDHSLALVRNHDEAADFVSEAVGSCA